ncbi:E3 ubiquitin-protein ligase UBR2-like [Rhopilema esculentum]|uniref:E3 ubiquitin-protein ligase UBR2-like n=1 Tax=Rhopilema esculentum TaxID=499914 RepID=UPI0031D2012D
MGNTESILGSGNNAARAAKAMADETARVSNDGELPNESSREILHRYIANIIPCILKTEKVNGVYKVLMDDSGWQKLVEWPLGFYICGENPDFGWEKIKAMNSPPQFCGKVFDIGDPTYSCKDCAADPTCVFCHDCFNKSSHVNHRYRIHTSSGNGGYCDCGDVEAWKKDPYCELHLHGSINVTEKDPKRLLPSGVIERATFMYQELLQYCVDMILWNDDGQYENLPEELRRPRNNATYMCMLYNDEVHTYDQVIRTLQQAIGCDKSEAIRYATIVDKEGRSMIYSGTKDACVKVCEDVKARTSRNGKDPLACEAIHQDIIAQQVAAIDMLKLLNKVTSYSDGLRRILCELTLNVIPPRVEPLLDVILVADTSLWKVARSGCHQLFMNSVLVDAYGKKKFAVSFAKVYNLIMNDFIEDDHDHGISASSMSVQIFTVPSLAQSLMLDYNLLQVVFSTFLEQLDEAITDGGYIDFQVGKRGRSVSLKREYYILHDLGYLLHHKPEKWTQEFRTVFLSAFDLFAKILRGMQGMEQVTRKLVTHIEYEPNWETGFLMQLWMMPVIEAMIAWTTSDTEVFRQVIEKCMEILLKLTPALQFADKNHSEVDPAFKLVVCDVSTQPVSVHLGLSRFLAGVLACSVKNGASLDELFNFSGKKKAESDEILLSLMEYPLRTLVFAAQVSAGMWRRNGYAVIHQVSYYQNVRCVSEMYDKDIIMLQVVAALMDSNYFLTALLDKYGLLNWLSLGFKESDLDEDAQRRTVVISEEFLFTVMAVLGERHVLGIGEVNAKDILRKEVVHRLALGPASRSEIVKNLPSKDPGDDEDCTFESLLDDVLKSVADFRQPGLTAKGLYQLKQSCFEECSQYFYHYSRSEQSKVLENRRKESKKASSSTGVKVPMPANFTPPYTPILNILSCSKMAKILAIILFRASNGDSKITPDTLIEEALYIVALGLYEDKRKREAGLAQSRSFVDLATSVLGIVNSKQLTIQNLLEDIQKKSKSQEYGELVDWVLSFLYDELSYKKNDMDESNQAVKRKQGEVDSEAKADSERRARLAREKREKVMAQMSQMQKSFIKKYEDFLDIDDGTNDEEDMSDGDLVTVEIESVAVGSGRAFPKQRLENVICILCQEKQDVTADGRTIVMTAFLQRSKVLSKAKGKSLIDAAYYNPVYPPRDMFTGVFMNTCGHVMHYECWQKYFDSVRDKEGRHLLRMHFHPHIDVAKSEYLCPLCSSFCNSVVPLLPAIEFKESTSQQMDTDEDLVDSERLLLELTKKMNSEAGTLFRKGSSPTATRLPSSLSSLKEFFQNFVLAGYELSNSAQDMIQRFATAVEKIGRKDSSPSSPSSKLLMAWNTCSYTIQAMECILRDENKSLFDLTSRKTDCMSSLVRYSAMSSSVTNAAHMQTECLRLLAALIPCNISELNQPCILDLDIFSAMLILRFSLPSLDLTGSNLAIADLVSNGTADQFLLNISLLAVLTQLLLSAPAEIDAYNEELTHLASETVKEEFAALWGKMRQFSNISTTDRPHEEPEKLFCYVIQQCLPFIRSSALFFHFLTGVAPPVVLAQHDESDHHRLTREVRAICGYLSLPTDIVSVMPLGNSEQKSSLAFASVVERWCSHDSVRGYFSNPKTATNMATFSSTPSRLIPLPKDYSSLITAASGFRCPMTGDISQNPTLCLVCGEMLCAQSYCCQALVDEKHIGSCTAHAEKCNETLGVFLLIRDCQILLLYNRTKGCLIASPYLDEYGEPDVKFRRGNPLYLSSCRYNNLQKLWLTHMIPQEIVRQMESNRNYMSVDWQQYL